MLFGLPFVFSKQVIQKIKIMDSIILLSVILLIATPFLTLSDFLLLQQPLIIAIFYNTNQKVGIKLPLNQVKITIPSNYGILASFFFLEISFLLISYPTNEIYHIIVVQVSVLGKFLQVLDQNIRNFVLLTLGLVLIIIISITEVFRIYNNYIKNSKEI